MGLSLVKYAESVMSCVFGDKLDSTYCEKLVNKAIKSELGLDIQLKLSTREGTLQISDIIIPARELGICATCGGNLMLLDSTKVAICEKCVYERGVVTGLLSSMEDMKKE